MRRVKPLINISYSQAIAFAAFLVLYEFMTYVSNDMGMPSMPQVIHDFNAPVTYIASSVTAFMLGGSSLQIILGPMADSFGRRRAMLIGVLVFIISTLTLACCQSIHQFMIARFFQGMGICYIGAVGYATLQDIFNDTDAVKLTAIMANLSIIAPLIGPLLGACILYYGSWRLIFFLIGGLSLFAYWGLWKYMPEPLGLMNTEGRTITAQAFNFSTVINNYRQLLQSKPFVTMLIMYGVMGIPCMIWIALSPVMIITNAKNSLFIYALWQIPMFSAFIFANTLLQRLIENIGLDKILSIGVICVLLALSCAWTGLYIYGSNFKSMVPFFVLYFFGYATASAPIYRKLFAMTAVSKGTTGALISLGTMLIQSAGIELGNHLFRGNNYLHLVILFLVLSIGIGICFYQLVDNRN